ncbi:hypothetical protein GCM10017752_62400 [Streptomyces roseoviridis]
MWWRYLRDRAIPGAFSRDHRCVFTSRTLDAEVETGLVVVQDRCPARQRADAPARGRSRDVAISGGAEGNRAAYIGDREAIR